MNVMLFLGVVHHQNHEHTAATATGLRPTISQEDAGVGGTGWKEERNRQERKGVRLGNGGWIRLQHILHAHVICQK